MCKRENEGNEQQRELEVVFAQLVAIDRARNSAEVDLAVNTLLQAIGEYTQAERTYIFEMMEEERIFTNIYEWCSEGVTPQIDNLQALTADDMPVWYRIFLRGESIIIDDLETVKESMPLEYDILKAQDIYSEISFPIWYRGKLMGFIGVDNPRVAKSRYFLNLLAVVGGYVGNAWENFRVARQLKQNRDALQQNRRDLEKAREEVTLNNEIISAISKIYVLIFRIDLEKDSMMRFPVRMSRTVSPENTAGHLRGCRRSVTPSWRPVTGKMCGSFWICPRWQDGWGKRIRWEWSI